MKTLTEAGLKVLRRAGRRPDGCVCPTPGLRGVTQDKVLKKLKDAGFITDSPCPTITEAGREAAFLPGEERHP